MKNKIIISITTFIYICFAFACHKPKTITCGDLPCPSETGANIVSCYINGKPFIVLGNKPHVDMLSCNDGNTIGPSFGGINTAISSRKCNPR
jgi:hypothetical protein